MLSGQATRQHKNLIEGGSAGSKPPLGFNAACLITFAIPERSEVKIEVFNILGQKVVTLLDESRDAGEHSVVFEADKLSSGIYYYRLKTASFSDVKSMVLLK